jgi:D-alanyl-D-alanine carboxypeptidase/D-alanyl-D-alanine-endopeptidase (penicillin-binding protein 4)
MSRCRSVVANLLPPRCCLGLLLACLLILSRPLAAATLEDLIAKAGFSRTDVAVLIEDMATDRPLVAHRADAPAPAASTLKLATALRALDTLGPEHRFATRVWATGQADAAGRLAGDLILEGGGDPLLDLDGLMALALSIRDAGITTVAGRFVLDDDALPLRPSIHPDQPLEAGYNAGIGALSLAFNRVERLPLRGGGSFTIPNLVERGPAWARLPFDGPATVPIQDAGRHAALVFRDLAASLGVTMPEPRRGAVADRPRLLGQVMSRPLRDIVQAMLLYSNNQVAEIVGLATTGAPSLEASAARLAADLGSALPAVDWQGFVLTNHSGLDAAARATPAQLLAILRLAEERHGIMALLPVAAWSGSLQSRFKTPQEALRVWAKTGSLDFASALVGYVLPPSGQPRRLAVLISDEASRRERDAVDVPPPAMRRAIDDFTLRARALRDDLASWALELGG